MDTRLGKADTMRTRSPLSATVAPTTRHNATNEPGTSEVGV